MAAAHRVPAICQKPFAPTLADAKAMVKACVEAGVPLMVHENFRWQSPIQAVRAVLDSGEIGTPFFGRISFRSAYDVFSGQPYLATGKRFIIEDLGIHILDIARFLLGDVSTITTRTARINPDIAGEDVATMLMDHESGATSVVDCSYATKLAVEPFPETLIEIDGSDGTIRLAQGYRLTVTGKSGTVVSDVSPPLLPWASRPWHNIQESVVAIQHALGRLPGDRHRTRDLRRRQSQDVRLGRGGLYGRGEPRAGPARRFARNDCRSRSTSTARERSKPSRSGSVPARSAPTSSTAICARSAMTASKCCAPSPTSCAIATGALTSPN